MVRKKPNSASSKRDQKLIHAAVVIGDRKAYAELMNLYWDRIYKMMLKKINDEDIANDLTIETFGKAFRNLHKYVPDFAFSTWLFKIANNNFIDHKRRSKHNILSINETFKDDNGNIYLFPDLKCEQPSPEEEFIRKQKSSLVHDIVGRLKPHYRKLIELRYFQEYSYQEIADEMQIPLGTVKARLFRAKELLCAILKKSGDNI
ncbi:MAG: sigma-70 family RNA polymerase sigma factor [Bacteroidales bacterium]|jgi:RNA polymerase sigma-70 factor (ECF subfamily)|nr:sigma-70 family RNA polymerase sigma factor [Bacteroidales bacterium]